MKRIIRIILSVILVVIGLVLFIYFGPKKAKVNEKVSLRIYQSVKVDDLNIKLINISDSRCSYESGTYCIWEGEISYKVVINKKTKELGTVKEKEIKYKDYVISLTDDNDSTHEIKFIVSKK